VGVIIQTHYWQGGVLDTFPNVAVALMIYLVLMVSNCSAERSFSKLKLIENRLRISTTQERLVNLAIMSIESDILQDTDCKSIIDDFERAKSRKVTGIGVVTVTHCDFGFTMFCV
jgi:hypothetical protein